MQDAWCQRWPAHHKDLEHALKSIDNLIVPQKTKWNGGEYGLEVKHAWVIWSYLQMVLKGTKGIDTSEIAAQSFDFVKVHGCAI